MGNPQSRAGKTAASLGVTLSLALSLVSGAIQDEKTITDALRHLRAAQALAADKNWKAAEEEFRIARQASELFEPATLGHAKVLFHLGHPFDAMLELEDFLKRNPDSVPALHLFATLIASTLENIDRSIEIMERCSRLAPGDPDVWQYLGNLYLLQRREAEAAASFKHVVELRPFDAYALASLAYAEALSGTIEEARERFDEALKLNGQAPEPNSMVSLIYAKFLLEQRRWADSLPVYNRVLEREPRSSEAHYGRAVANENLRNFAEAEKDALAAIRDFPTPRKDAYLLLLRVARAEKDQSKADKYLADIERLDAEEARRHEDVRQVQTWLFKAEPLFLEGKYAEAATAYEELVKIAPLFYEAYFALGMCYANLSEAVKAEAAFRKYLELQPLSADGHASLGLLLLERQRIDEAESELRRALEIEPEMPEARKSLDAIQLIRSQAEKRSPSAGGEIEKAQKQMGQRNFRAALETLAPLESASQKPTPEVYLLISTCHLNLGETDPALQTCERAMAQYPDEPLVENFYVTLLQKYVPVPRMKEKLEQAMAARPRAVGLIRALAVLELHLDYRSEQARQLSEKLLDLAPSDPNSHYIYAEWAFLNHREALAVEEWEKTLAVAGQPDARMQMDVYTLIGDALRRLGKPEQADAAFTKAFQANAGLEQHNPASAFFYVQFLAEQGRTDDSQKIVESIIKWAPKYGPALLQRATWLGHENRSQEAITTARQALEGTDLSPEQIRAAHALLAKTHFLLGQAEAAKAHQQWLQSH